MIQVKVKTELHSDDFYEIICQRGIDFSSVNEIRDSIIKHWFDSVQPYIVNLFNPSKKYLTPICIEEMDMLVWEDETYQYFYNHLTDFHSYLMKKINIFGELADGFDELRLHETIKEIRSAPTEEVAIEHMTGRLYSATTARFILSLSLGELTTLTSNQCQEEADTYANILHGIEKL